MVFVRSSVAQPEGILQLKPMATALARCYLLCWTLAASTFKCEPLPDTVVNGTKT